MKRFQLEQLIFLLIILGVAGWMLFESQSFSDDKAKTFPQLIASFTVIIVLVELVTFMISSRNSPELPASQTISGRFGGIFPYLVWLLAYFAVIYVIGMVAASGLFVFLFLFREGKVKWYYALIAGLIIIAFLIQLEGVMNLKWPRSIIDPIEMLGLH